VYHVNHNWRQLVAGSPHLWTRIQVQSKTRPEIVSFMRDKAGAHPIELEYVGGPYWATDDAHEPDPKFLPTIQDILRTSSQNIKSIAIYSSQSVPQQLLVRIVEGADRLESLIISLGERSYYSMPPIPVNTRELSAVVIPGLRRLSLEGLMCPWKSSLLTSSPHLTDVTLRRTEPSSPQGVADLLDFLRRLPKIECLRFRLLRPHSQPVNEVFFLGKSDLSRATPLFRLQELSIYSESPSLLSAILSAITIPKFIPSLSLLSGPRPRARAISTHDRLHDRIGELISRGCEGDDSAAPQELEVASDWAKCVHLSSNGLLGTMKVSAVTPRQFSRSTTRTAFQLPWSYQRLTTLTVNLPSTAVPDSVWPVLAKLDKLEVIQIAAEGPQPFLNALRMDGGQLVDQKTAQGQPGSTTFIFGRPAFPGLRVVRFTPVSEGIRWYAGRARDRSAFRVAEHLQTFFKDILDALRRRHGGALEELAFLSCEYGPQDTKATLRPLLAVAKSVRWEESVLNSSGVFTRGPTLLSDKDRETVQSDVSTSRNKRL
jgi:hypothetical protein